MNPRIVASHIELASQMVNRARRAGAETAEVSIDVTAQLSARVRLGELEQLAEAQKRTLALRVIRQARVGVGTTSDLSEAGLERCVADALLLAELTEPDELAAPAEPKLLHAAPDPDIDLFDPQVEALDAADAIALAEQAERAALELDARLTLGEGACFERASSVTVLALTGGFSGGFRGTEAALAVSPALEDAQGKRRMGTDFTAGRHLGQLEDAAEVGREAARRALAKVGARRVPTCEAPVVFQPEIARSLVETFARCVLGGAVWRKSSYLAGRIDSQVASSRVTLVDDPLLPRGLGSRPFDAEGLPARPNVVVDQGMLRTFLLDCYAARKLGAEPTGSAGRAGGTPTAVTSNFVLRPGETPPEQILASTPRGLYVTEILGFGFNPVTGDYSHGAAGFWIEDGRLAFPVSEVTISSNLDRMMRSIDAVGTDLVLESATAAPTLRIASMTVGGA